MQLLRSFDKVVCKPHYNPVPNISYAYTPDQICTAYGLNLIDTGLELRGTGIKIAVIVAYHYPNLQNDFNVYCNRFNLPPQTLQIINFGSAKNNGWAAETCLDVQTIHAVAPGAQIMVVEARSSSYSDMVNAINYASKNGANIINMSFGSSEFNNQKQIDSIFSNKNICYLASSGDLAAKLEYPSSSPNVLSVGGTSIYLNDDNTRKDEVTWDGGGSGPSIYMNKPTYQSNLPGAKRITPDISGIANPNTGFRVYCSVYGGWNSFGGTSLSCPLMSGIIAICNQLRKKKDKSLLSTVLNSNNSIQQILYKQIYTNNVSYSENIFDVIQGRDGKYTATRGYDLCCGLGSCKGDKFCTTVSDL